MSKDLASDTMYFHAQYRQAMRPKVDQRLGSNDTPTVSARKNLDGEGNYVWLEATGQGHFVGVTMSVLQNQDGWWGEGDDMFFIDGEKHRLSMARALRITSWARGILGTILFHTPYMGLQSKFGICGQPFVRISFSSGLADSIYEEPEGND